MPTDYELFKWHKENNPPTIETNYWLMFGFIICAFLIIMAMPPPAPKPPATERKALPTEAEIYIQLIQNYKVLLNIQQVPFKLKKQIRKELKIVESVISEMVVAAQK